MSEALLLPALSAGITSIVIWLRLQWKDIGVSAPVGRSLHTQPTAHGGGLGIVVSALTVGWLADISAIWLACVGLLAVISAIDDWRPLPLLSRLPVHLLAAAAVVFLLTDTPIASGLCAVLLIGWATNAYNFMDGADGLAGSMTAIGFAAYAAIFLLAGNGPLFLFSISISISSLSFLHFNWHPARIFMGDVGSIPIGFLAGALGWHGVVTGIWDAWFPLLVFSPFLADATTTLTKRAASRKKFWQPHREHYYQRMVLLGMNHGSVCKHWVNVMIIAAAAATITKIFAASAGWIVLLAWSSVLVVLGVRIDKKWDSENCIKP